MPVHETATRKALIIAVAALAALTLLAVILKPPPAPPVDRSRAPQWIKDLCHVRGDLWRPWREIVIHHSGGSNGNLEMIDEYHRTDPKRLYESAGYHFVIGNGSKSDDGEIEVGPRWYRQQVGAHCRGHNSDAIGICLIGNFDLDGHRPTVEQFKRLLELTAYLSVRYDIPPERIHLHREVEDASTVCPGKNFPTDLFREALKAQIASYRSKSETDEQTSGRRERE